MSKVRVLVFICILSIIVSSYSSLSHDSFSLWSAGARWYSCMHEQILRFKKRHWGLMVAWQHITMDSSSPILCLFTDQIFVLSQLKGFFIIIPLGHLFSAVTLGEFDLQNQLQHSQYSCSAGSGLLSSLTITFRARFFVSFEIVIWDSAIPLPSLPSSANTMNCVSLSYLCYLKTRCLLSKRVWTELLEAKLRKLNTEVGQF